MDITYHGNSCFNFKGNSATLAVNPHREAGKLKPQVILTSLNDKDQAELESSERTFDWPGEYEIKNIPIVGIPAFSKSLGDEEDSEKGDKTIIFYFEIDGIKICHLGNLGHKLTSEMVKELDAVDILLLPVGPTSNLNNKKALDVIESIDPRVIIPMSQEEDPAQFLKELGAENIEAEEKFTIKKASELPVESRRYISLKAV